VRFLYMARGSAGEVRSHLYVARDLDYITGTEFERMASRVDRSFERRISVYPASRII
jgi:four helix bundle protein